MSRVAVCLMGPTASGKTALACELVQQFPFEIISVDSVMIYRGMDIGSAKPDQETCLHVPHHLLDILNPLDSYSAAQFCDDAQRLCDEITARGNLPLLVGGTMMYFRALQQGLSQLPQADETVRARLLHQAEEEGWPSMHRRLTEVDPVSAARIHPHDAQRIQRALEVYHLTDKPLSLHVTGQLTNRSLDFVNFLLMPEDRRWLHERIGMRFEQMLSQGFIEEVESLIQQWGLTLGNPSMRSVGYRQVFAYLQGEYDYPTLCQKGVSATRQLAKRQLTWLRHWPDGYSLKADDPGVHDEIVAIVQKIMDNTAQ